MFLLSCLLICLLTATGAHNDFQTCELNHTWGSKYFPENFKFGVSTASYQIEGGWNEDGRGESIWDTFTHKHPELIDDHSNGDVAADSYHRFDQDLEALKDLGVNFYRFSISWSRILPNGDVSSKNQKGINYYNMMIDKLLANGIEPMVTMFHYDLPETLSSYGGFTNPLLIKYFSNYARLLFQVFGDRVKTWITFNEPSVYCSLGYGDASYPPMVRDPGVAHYMCMDTTLKAHAEVYHLYRKEYFGKQKGKIGITLNTGFYFSKTNNSAVVDRAMQYSLGFLANPIFGKSGNYPEVMLKDIARNSEAEGRPWSRLQSLSASEIKFIKKCADFLAINYYSSSYVEDAYPPQGEVPSLSYDSRLKYEVDERWRKAKSSWLYCVPEGLEGLLRWIKDNYNNVEVIITENGWSDNGQLYDVERIEYMKSHLQAVLNAINAGCNVSAYTHWSLMDNFEWLRGYTEKFGLYAISRTSPEKERLPKQSVFYYRNVTSKKTIPDFSPDY